MQLFPLVKDLYCYSGYCKFINICQGGGIASGFFLLIKQQFISIKQSSRATILGGNSLCPPHSFPVSFTPGLTGVYGFGGPYGETVATGAYRAFRVTAAGGHSGAFSGNDSNRTSKFQGGNYTKSFS